MKKRILVIDDEPDFTGILKMGLEAGGYFTVQEENDATQAISAAREFGPDLVVLDIMMPHIDGSDIAARIKADPHMKDIPILFVTALVTGEEDGPSGGNTFLSKSTPLSKLIERITEKLDERANAVPVNQ